LSYVPEVEQRGGRTLTRTKAQLTCGQVRLQSQVENLLEECQIKLSSVVSDLLGARGQRSLRARAQGETGPARLAELGDKRLRPRWPPRSGLVPEARRAPVCPAVIVRPQATARGDDYSSNLPRPRSGNKIVNSRLGFGVEPPACGYAPAVGARASACAG
jgi:hypothetical protein